MRPRHKLVALVLLLGLAAALRLSVLELRAPHHDEGVNGWFVEKMRQRGGYYHYDPENYHGPLYFYVLSAAREHLGYGLWQLRLPGALIGVALCLLPLLLRRRLGWGPALAACGLLAASPTLVYYARYAIHETLLVTLGFAVAAFVLRWSDSGRAGWLIGAAAAVALMIATKETTILFLGVSGLWLGAEVAVESLRARRLTVLGRRVTWTWRVPAIAAAIVAVMATIHVLLFTGFFQEPGSIRALLWRSVKAYFVWTDTGTGHSGHEKDACYYLHLGVRYELALYALAVIGLLAGWRDRWVRGPAVVGFGMLAAYSLIAYKMPWLPASWLALLALPAARGLVALGRVLADELSPRLGGGAALALAMIPALLITARSSFVQPAHKDEQLAYVHTASDYNRWTPLLAEGAARVGRQRLRVAVDHDATWPLPWTLLPYRRTRWSVGGGEDLMIVAVSRAAAAEERMTGLYLRRRYQIRDSAEPAYVYLRHGLYAPAIAARADRDRFELIGRARLGSAAVAMR
jgi:uncharacterized protein (TIGR03663 family)